MPDSRQRRGLVLDTSVWINLLATGMVQPILTALKAECYAPVQVLAEIKRDPVTGKSFEAESHPLHLLRGLVIIAEPKDQELDVFFDIIGAPSVDALGDGEAAAIALALSRELRIVIDDRKARRILRERFGQIETLWTVDLLRAPAVVKALGSQVAKECFVKAERFGRMHVPRP